MQKFRIAIIGPSGSGKTTLANAIGKELNIEVIPENFADIVNAAQQINISIGNPEVRHQKINAFFNVCENWLNSRMNLQNSLQAYVLDRCCFDILERYISNLMPIHKIQNLITECRKSSLQYDAVIFLPISNWSSNDSVNEYGLNRSKNFSLHLREFTVLSGLVRFASQSPILHLPAKGISVDERVKFIIEYLENLKTNL